MNTIEDLYLPTDGAADVNQLISEAVCERRSGTIAYFMSDRGLAWCGLVVEGALIAQLATVAQSEEEAQAIAASLSHVTGLTLRAAQESAALIAKARH